MSFVCAATVVSVDYEAERDLWLTLTLGETLSGTARREKRFKYELKMSVYTAGEVPVGLVGGSAILLDLTGGWHDG